MLDLRTAALFVTILFTIQAIIALLFTLLARSYRGTGAWAAASLLAVIGSILYGLRGLIPDFFSVLLANAIYIVALSLLYDGVRQFLHVPRPMRYLFGFPTFIFLLIFYLTYGRDDIILRSVVMSLYIVISMSASARLLILRAAPEVRRSHWFTAGTFLVFVLFHALRVIPLFTVAPGSVLETDLLLSFPMIISSICGVLWTAGIALMITERLVVELKFTATHDFLTNTLNRRAAQSLLESEIRRTRSQATPLSILLMDVDHFKTINDRYGHASGDVVLVTLVERVAQAIGKEAHMARWGGEEFLIILPATPAVTAFEIAQTLRRLITNSPYVVEATPIFCSVSVGVATATTDDLDDLLRRADRALYHAKHAGRNTVFADSSTLAEVTA